MMMMVHIPKGVMPCQVDDFPPECARSKKGGLHFRTNSTKRITEDEYNHVLASPKHKALGARLILVHKGDSRLVKAAKASEAKAASKAKPSPAPKSPVKEDTKDKPLAPKKAKSSS